MEIYRRMTFERDIMERKQQSALGNDDGDLYEKTLRNLAVKYLLSRMNLKTLHDNNIGIKIVPQMLDLIEKDTKPQMIL